VEKELSRISREGGEYELLRRIVAISKKLLYILYLNVLLVSGLSHPSGSQQGCGLVVSRVLDL
jgi:hypothetical protein